MEVGYDIAGFIKLTDGRSIENVTPHKIAVVAFIREFGLLKQKAKELAMFQCTMAPKYRKDFCMLALKLIQCPDLEFKELEALLTNSKYNLLSAHLQNFCAQLQHIYENGVCALVDCINSTVDKLIIEATETSPTLVSKNSVLGFYLRRMVLYIGKLTFEQVYGVHKAFCIYYQKGRPGRLVRTMSRDKLNNPDYSTTPIYTSPIRRPDEKQEAALKSSLYDRENCMEDCCWSRKQAELFVAQQASYLQNNEAKAMPAAQLQKVLMQIMKDIPDFSDVHFVSFLNQLRARDVCGAQDCLYEYFDRAVCSSAAPNPVSMDRNKTIRYAAINQAAMYSIFGFDELADNATEEALLMAQEAGDATGVSQIVPTEQPVLPNGNLTPAEIFAQFRVCTEPTNYQCWSESLLRSIGQTAALWSLLGNTEMLSIYSQLALNLNASSGVTYDDSTAITGTATACAARSNNNALRALFASAAPLTSPAPFTTRSLMRLQYHHACRNALYSGKWVEADQCIQQLSSIDRWESQLLRSEMYYFKGETDLAVDSLIDIFENCQTEKDSLHYASIRIRAMIMQSQLDGSNNDSRIILLNDALLMAKRSYLHYMAAVIEMHIGNTQLLMGCGTLALTTVRRVLPIVMANGSVYDMARAILLYTRCRVATAPEVGQMRREILASCCRALDTAANHFRLVEAHSRLRETLYLQAMLYNEIGMYNARNQCAYKFRQLDCQQPSSSLGVMTF